MYIAQAFSVKNDWWRYLIGVAVAIVGVVIFSLPHSLALAIKVLNGEVDESRLNNVQYLMSLFEPNVNLIYMLLPFVGGLIFLLIAVKFIHNQSFTKLTTSRVKIDWSRVLFGFMVVAVLNSVMIGLDYFLSPEDYKINFNLIPFLVLVVIALLLIPLQTSFEEYMFRGYLMQGMGVLFKNRWAPLLLTSLIFGGLHFFNPEVTKMGNVVMIYYIGTGVFLGVLTLMDEGLELALGFHAGNNVVTALLVTADWTAFQTHSILKDVSEPSAGFDVLIPIFVVYPLILLWFAKKYNWTNWREKLFGKVQPPNTVELIQDDTNI